MLIRSRVIVGLRRSLAIYRKLPKNSYVILSLEGEGFSSEEWNNCERERVKNEERKRARCEGVRV